MIKFVAGLMLGLAVASAAALTSPGDPIPCRLILRDNATVTNTTIIGATIEDAGENVTFAGNEIVFAGGAR
jgi:hypothetical protein